MTRPPAPPLTPAEQDRVDAFEAAPVLAEAWREPHGIGLDGRCQECDGPAAPDRPDTAAEVDEVETVARVLWTAANNSPLPWPEGDDKSRTRWRADFRRMARAAIQALAARRPATEAEQVVERVRAEIAEEETYREQCPAWEITIAVPTEAGDDFADRLFETLADAAYEAQPEDRGNWDVFCSAVKNPTSVPVHLLRAALDGAARDGSDG